MKTLFSQEEMDVKLSKHTCLPSEPGAEQGCPRAEPQPQASGHSTDRI